MQSRNYAFVAAVICGLTVFISAAPAQTAETCYTGPIPAVQAQPRAVKLYLAGPLGFSEAGTHFKDCILIPKLHELGYDVIDPWRLTPREKIDPILKLPYGPEKRAAWKALDPEIARNNEAGIDRADAVLAVLDGTDVDSGTAAEIGYAYGRGKPVLGYRGDFRLSSDNEGSQINLQVEYFIEQRGGEIITSLDDLPRALATFGAIARLAAVIPNEKPIADTIPAGNPGENQSEAVKDIIRFFSAAFTIVLALALSEAFQQFVAESPADSSAASLQPAQIIRWDRLWALLVLLLFLLPFFQGMSRYFFLTYDSSREFPANYGASLMVDGGFFTLEAALFFIMSRALAPRHWYRFYASVLVLLITDSIWALIAMFWHSAKIEPWMALNIVSAAVVFIAYLRYRKKSDQPLPDWLNYIAVLGALLRTALDYYLMWPFYFPIS